MDLHLPRRRGRLLAGTVALAVLAGAAGTWTAAASGGEAAVHREDRRLAMPEGPGAPADPGAKGSVSGGTAGKGSSNNGDDGKGDKGDGDNGKVRIDTSFYTSGPSSQRRPAILLGHGFGGSKKDVRHEAEDLARDGYAVLTWSARGFGRSTGRIGINDRDHEVADVRRLIDWLAARPDVKLDASGDPRVGVTGASYGGAISLLAAGYDKRVDAIAPQNTYWNLADALFPQGVFKKLWAGIFFTSGSSSASMGGLSSSAPQAPMSGDHGCGDFEQAVCKMYERVAVAGKPDAAARKMLADKSPSAVAERIKVPTLIFQGQNDSLFPLDQADAMSKAIRANGAPVDVDWNAGGHDGGDQETDRIRQRVTSWFDRYLKKDEGTDTGPAFRVSRTGGIDSTNARVQLRGASSDRYPGLDGAATRAVRLAGREQTIANPAGGSPPAISAVPGGGALSQLSSVGAGISLDFPGQYARFESAPLRSGLRVTGSPSVDVRVTSDSADAVLFGKVYDVAPDGKQTLPSQLVSPVRVEGAKAGKTVRLRLPAVDHNFQSGHRMRLVLSATDLGYASPAEPATYTLSLGGSAGQSLGKSAAHAPAAPALSVPTATAVQTESASLPWWVWGLPLGGLVLAAALVLIGRRRVVAPAADPELAEVPLLITDLSKRYAKSADRYAVRDLTIRVERGQVLGLLGPNGAGKTTTLRMLMGLIRPDAGEIRIFGHAIRPGAPVLSRVGAFVEGAGFLPHLSGRANLDLYWQATGRPAADAHIEEALTIAGLGDALQRAVRTYSQGMRQRLAIAQAMLGLPDLLILDEPTNGLDPPQIREMREVMVRYAAAGRTVIVSSHLLAEVEQTCTHLVVMDRGKLVSAGRVSDIVGSGNALLVGVAGELTDAMTDKVGALPGVGTAVQTDGGLLVTLDGGTAPELLVELVRLDVPVTGLGPHRRLEDAFLTLIGGTA
ncbi:alpha/beta fold hydrolase [Streptomyces sp. H27-D2]|uniref:alpha/beta fold hydrolase n=1 Tax=Streptomyces sp. H27-D2 TaxID=3046304 RepID=UPI002DB9BDED|nr:alpha/beta fold hydrolase [Streptomyces sp. H27-D2]MEC4019776.1 alpha/beta fold hydrolase [Streptomyces sp. H27-D2]